LFPRSGTNRLLTSTFSSFVSELSVFSSSFAKLGNTARQSSLSFHRCYDSSSFFLSSVSATSLSSMKHSNLLLSKKSPFEAWSSESCTRRQRESSSLFELCFLDLTGLRLWFSACHLEDLCPSPEEKKENCVQRLGSISFLEMILEFLES